MPKAPKSKTVKEEDTKPYVQGEGSKSPSKSPQKAGGKDPWTPDQVWALFQALYKKGAFIVWIYLLARAAVADTTSWTIDRRRRLEIGIGGGWETCQGKDTGRFR